MASLFKSGLRQYFSLRWHKRNLDKSSQEVKKQASLANVRRSGTGKVSSKISIKVFHNELIQHTLMYPTLKHPDFKKRKLVEEKEREKKERQEIYSSHPLIQCGLRCHKLQGEQGLSPMCLCAMIFSLLQPPVAPTCPQVGLLV